MILADIVRQMREMNVKYRDAVKGFETIWLLQVLQDNNGNGMRSAKALGMHRNTLSRTVRIHGIDLKQLRPRPKKPRDFQDFRERLDQRFGPKPEAVRNKISATMAAGKGNR